MIVRYEMTGKSVLYWIIIAFGIVLILQTTIPGAVYAQIGSGAPESPSVSILTNKREIRAGEGVAITFRVIYPTDYQPLDPIVFLPSIKGLNKTGMDRRVPRTVIDVETVEITRSFTSGTPGNINIKPVTIKFKTPTGDSIWVESNGLTIVVLERDAPEVGLRDIKGPKGVGKPFNWLLVILTLIIVGAIIFFVVLFVRGLPKHEKIPDTPGYISIEEEYIDTLRRIELPDENDRDGVKTYCISISDNLRNYLSSKSGGFDTAETTSEVRYKLHRERYGESVIATFTTLARSLDMVKYAKQKPSTSVMESTRNSAIDFIRLIGSFERR